MTAELKALEFNKHDGTFTELSQKSHEKKSYDGMKQLHEKSNWAYKFWATSKNDIHENEKKTSKEHTRRQENVFMWSGLSTVLN